MVVKRQEEFLLELYQKLAVKHNVRPSDVEEIYSHIFTCVKRAIGKSNYPTVQLMNFGKFYTSASDVRGRISKMIKRYRAGEVDKITLNKFIGKYWRAYKKMNARESKQAQRKK